MSEQQRAAVVTGAAGGIGRELVLGLLGKGLRVAAVDRTAQGLTDLAQAAQARQQELLYEPSSLRSRLVLRVMPWIARAGLTRRVFGPPFRLTAYGTERVTLTA